VYFIFLYYRFPRNLVECCMQNASVLFEFQIIQQVRVFNSINIHFKERTLIYKLLFCHLTLKWSCIMRNPAEKWNGKFSGFLILFIQFMSVLLWCHNSRAIQRPKGVLANLVAVMLATFLLPASPAGGRYRLPWGYRVLYGWSHSLSWEASAQWHTQRRLISRIFDFKGSL
jgi:hypothetical protein